VDWRQERRKRFAGRFLRQEGRERSTVVALPVSVVVATHVAQLLGPTGELGPLALRELPMRPSCPQVLRRGDSCVGRVLMELTVAVRIARSTGSEEVDEVGP
jgi:hypothetical protein